MMTKGVDLSYHNGTVDFDKIKNAGYTFVILRLGYRGWGNGALVKDTKFDEYFTLAKKAGLNIGVYFFSQAISPQEAKQEADFCLKIIGNSKLEYPVYIDQELSGASGNKGRADNCNKPTRTEIIKTFCDTIEKAGMYAGVYMSESWLRNNVDYSQLTKYDKWLAKWSILKPSTNYGSYGMWQNSNNTTVSGVTGRVDTNISYYDYPKIMKTRGLNNHKATVKYNVQLTGLNEEAKIAVLELCEDLALNVFMDSYLETEG